MTLALSALIIALALAFDIRIASQFKLPKFIVLQVGVLIMGMAWAWHLWRGEIKKIDGNIVRVVIALCMWMIVITFTAWHPQTAFWGYSGEWQGLITQAMYLCLFLIVATSKINIERILKIYVLTMSAVAAYAIVQYFGYDFVNFPKYSTVSTMGNRGIMASAVMMVAPVALHFGFKKKAWWLSAVAICVAVVLSGQRMPLTALFVSMSIVIISRFKGRGALVVSATALSAVVLIAAAGNTKFQRIQEDRRWHYWPIAIETIKANPIVGVGLDNFRHAYPMYRTPEIAEIESSLISESAHNGYLNKAAEGGIPYLAFYLAFVTFTMREIIRRKTALHTAILAPVIGFLIQDITGWPSIALTPYFYILLGLGVNRAL